MKHLIFICLILGLTSLSIQAQETIFSTYNAPAIGLNPLEDSITISAFPFKVANYGLGWYFDPLSEIGPTEYMSAFGGIRLYTGRSERMFIASNGNIGIGTSDPQSLLAVNGKITTKSISVTLAGWPDYVFKKTYFLKPLKDLGKYIRLNKHLPDIPTASDVYKDGVDLGETQKKLLQKIEELTLYLIKEDDRIAEALNTITKQSIRLDRQAREIRALKNNRSLSITNSVAVKTKN